MNIDDLKSAWEKQKQMEGIPLLSEQEIFGAIQQELAGRASVRRLAYNMSSFMFLLVVCQAC